MSSWLFTNNPDDYRFIDALNDRVGQIEWLASRYWKDMLVGDRVFLWQNKGDQPNNWGIHAVGELISVPRLLSTERFDEYWLSKEAKKLGVRRVRVRLQERAATGKHLSKRKLEGHPVLSTLPNLAFARATNFKLTDDHVGALMNEWLPVARTYP